MPAYLIVRANVTDMQQYQEYMKLTPAIVEKYGGQFIIRGGEIVVLEGPADQPPTASSCSNSTASMPPSRMYNSDEYQAAIKVRQGAAEASFIVMEAWSSRDVEHA